MGLQLAWMPQYFLHSEGTAHATSSAKRDGRTSTGPAHQGLRVQVGGGGASASSPLNPETPTSLPVTQSGVGKANNDSASH